MLIRALLNFLMFPMCFAAGAVAVGGGATSAPTTGGGDPGNAGSDSGAGNAESGATGGRVIPSSAEGGQGTTELGATADDDFGSFEDFETTEAETGGEEYNYKTIKEALKAHPEQFKAVKKAVSMVKRFQEHFESPEQAAELLTDIQTAGGWDSVKQELGETATFLNGWNAGDPAVVNSWLDENGEGLNKNMPTILERWQKSDPQGWAHDAAGTFMATMLQPDSKTGLSPIAALNMLGQKEGIKDSPEFQTLMNRIAGIQRTADQAPPKPAAKGPDETKLTQREQALKQQEANMQRQALGGKAAPILNKQANDALAMVAGARKLSDTNKANLISDINREFARLMEKDADGKSKRQRLLAAGQHDQWLKMVGSAASRTMPIAARNVWRKYAGIAGISTQERTQRKAEGQQRQESGSGGTSEAALTTKHPGDGRNVDRDAMREMFGSRDKADDAFLWGSQKHGGKRVWIERGTKKLFMY
jgi:hypothetical protein